MEIEIKAKVKSFKKIKLNLKKLGAKKLSKKTQIDKYYLSFGCLFNGKERRVFRTRYETGKKKMRLEAHRYLNNFSGEEYETEVSDKEMAEKILKQLKFKNIITVEKMRESFKLKNMEVVLDKVRGLGCFVEVELMGRNTEKNKNKILKIIDLLGIPKNNIVWEMRYHSMMMKKKGYKHFYF